ncbi:hypothetical protein E6R60_26325 [Streptomyces sp. A0642]|uniref:hypothetical protein n=1 Tax=Streptomyces sp. A0642 TaxID=2563100 RepID=UPI0010A2543B|nr:hypothetical protein [Streptomyces sp. A0642]THA72451.1 hypothetical protein E6R60_26325 [Streptomyces sp. A0642]
MRRLTRLAVTALAVTGLALGATACSEEADSSSRAKENTARQSNYDKLVARQPSHTLTYSPTRDTKNFWIDTWGKTPNKLSYVYIQNANGEYGYFVLKGLPVTYCVSLLPPEQKSRVDVGEYEGDAYIQAPSMDGTFSSNSNCDAYYGKDASTGAYVEFSVGQNQSYFLYDKPLDLPQFKDAKPLGPTTLKK